MANEGSGNKLPIGVNEVLAIGLGAAALMRIRRRRKQAAEREASDRAKQVEEGNTGKPGPSQA